MQLLLPMVLRGPIGILTYVAVAVDGLAWALTVDNSLRARLPTNVFLAALQQQSHMGPHVHTVEGIQVQAKLANTSLSVEAMC
jgi:cell division septal protein FtsQ